MGNIGRWYNQTSGMNRAYEGGLLDKKWIDNYCLNEGRDCIRKKQLEEAGYVSLDYVLPDGLLMKN